MSIGISSRWQDFGMGEYPLPFGIGGFWLRHHTWPNRKNFPLMSPISAHALHSAHIILAYYFSSYMNDYDSCKTIIK